MYQFRLADKAVRCRGMNRTLATALIAAVVFVLVGCASGRPPRCGEPGGYQSTVCQQYDYLIQIYRPGSRPPGW
jgi:hypothetical protein